MVFIIFIVSKIKMKIYHAFKYSGTSQYDKKFVIKTK